jgi:hypothetical protein
MRFRQPINTVHDCRVALKTPPHARKTSDRQHDREHQKNKTTSRETAHALLSWRRFNPGVHAVVISGSVISDN